MAYSEKLKKEAKKLRALGNTYNEIRKKIGIHIPKSTLSNWCSTVDVPEIFDDILKKKMAEGGHRGRLIALAVNKHKRDKYLEGIRQTNLHFTTKLQDNNFAKVALAMLYLGEGSKGKRGSLSFGNSNPEVIKLFLRLLRQAYPLDEKKFRGTLQCRADQNTEKLRRYWSTITEIPLSQFYKTQIDPRTVGKPSKKKDYKGVCRIDYFSAHLFNELSIIANIAMDGPVV